MIYFHYAADTNYPAGPNEAPGSPVGHVQKEGASGGVELKTKKPLKFRYKDIFVSRAHAAEFLHKLLV